MAVIFSLKQGSCKDRHLAFLLGELAILAIHNSFTVNALHIPGYRNVHADAQSRFNLQGFFSAVSDADTNSQVVPEALLMRLLFPPSIHTGKI